MVSPRAGQVPVLHPNPPPNPGHQLVEETLFLWGPLVTGIPVNLRPAHRVGTRVLAGGGGRPEEWVCEAAFLIINLVD